VRVWPWVWSVFWPKREQRRGGGLRFFFSREGFLWLAFSKTGGKGGGSFVFLLGEALVFSKGGVTLVYLCGVSLVCFPKPKSWRRGSGCFSVFEDFLSFFAGKMESPVFYWFSDQKTESRQKVGGGLSVDKFRLGFFLLFPPKFHPRPHACKIFLPPCCHCNMVFIGEVLLGFQTSPLTFSFLFLFFCKF